jgi:antitoxin component YwqK of YwqJK toxin-antitoxin module
MESMKKLLAAMFVALLMVGCGGPDLDDKETLDGIIAEAIVWGKLQERAKEGEKLAYAPNQETPYTGWVKVMWGNEQVRLLAQYEDGKGDGLFTSWYEKGQKEMEGNVKDGKPDGFGTGWYENGQKKAEVNCKDGKEDGLSTGWYENGDKKWESSFKGGKLMTSVQWKPNGEKCPVTNVVDGNGVLVGYYENGQKDSEGNYKGGKLMTVVVWKPNGEKCPVTKLIDGNGVALWYKKDGTEELRQTYKDGIKVF